MDFESLENMDKSEFLPLCCTVKQELLDTANGIDDGKTETNAEHNEINSATPNIVSAAAEVNNPDCDSAEKQVKLCKRMFKTTTTVLALHIF